MAVGDLTAMDFYNEIMNSVLGMRYGDQFLF